MKPVKPQKPSKFLRREEDCAVVVTSTCEALPDSLSDLVSLDQSLSSANDKVTTPDILIDVTPTALSSSAVDFTFDPFQGLDNEGNVTREPLLVESTDIDKVYLASNQQQSLIDVDGDSFCTVDLSNRIDVASQHSPVAVANVTGNSQTLNLESDILKNNPVTLDVLNEMNELQPLDIECSGMILQEVSPSSDAVETSLLSRNGNREAVYDIDCPIDDTDGGVASTQSNAPTTTEVTIDRAQAIDSKNPFIVENFEEFDLDTRDSVPSAPANVQITTTASNINKPPIIDNKNPFVETADDNDIANCGSVTEQSICESIGSKPYVFPQATTIPIRKLPVPVRSKSKPNGSVTVPEQISSAVVFKPPSGRPAPLSFKDVGVVPQYNVKRSTYGDDVDSIGRPKSVNILQSAFVDDDELSLRSGGSLSTLSTIKTHNSRGAAVRSKSVAGFSKPRTVPSDAQSSVAQVGGRGAGGPNSEPSLSTRDASHSNDFRNGGAVVPSSNSSLTSRIELTTNPVVKVPGNANNAPKLQKNDSLNRGRASESKYENFDRNEESSVVSGNSRKSQRYALVRRQESNDEDSISERVDQLIRANDADDCLYDFENEMLHASACRPVSRTSGEGLFFRNNNLNPFASDSTDTDDSDDMTIGSGRYSDTEVSVTGEACTGDIEEGSKRSQMQKSSNRRLEKKSNLTKPPVSRKIRSKKTKKEKLAKRNLQKEKLRRAKVEDDGKGPAPMTEREKSIERYRATLMRIDRKLRKEGFGETVKCVDGKSMTGSIVVNIVAIMSITLSLLQIYVCIRKR